MAVTPTIVFQQPLDGIRLHVVDVAGATGYPTNGEPLTKQQLGFSNTADPEFSVLPSFAAGYIAQYNATTQKLIVYWTGAAVASVFAEITNGTSLAGVTFRLYCFGNYAV